MLVNSQHNLFTKQEKVIDLKASLLLPLSISWYFGFNKVIITSIAWSATLEDLKLDMTIIMLSYFINTVITSSSHFPKLTRNRTGTALQMQHTYKTFSWNMGSFFITVMLKSKLPPSSHKIRNGIAHDLNQIVYNAIRVSWEIITCKGHLLCDSHSAKRL